MANSNVRHVIGPGIGTSTPLAKKESPASNLTAGETPRAIPLAYPEWLAVSIGWIGGADSYLSPTRVRAVKPSIFSWHFMLTFTLR